MPHKINDFGGRALWVKLLVARSSGESGSFHCIPLVDLEAANRRDAPNCKTKN
jgi:hypothetical protein